MVVEVRLNNLLFNGGFKMCLDVRCLLYKYIINIDIFRCFIMGWIYKILDNMFYCKYYFGKVCFK